MSFRSISVFNEKSQRALSRKQNGSQRLLVRSYCCAAIQHAIVNQAQLPAGEDKNTDVWCVRIGCIVHCIVAAVELCREDYRTQSRDAYGNAICACQAGCSNYDAEDASADDPGSFLPET